MLDKALEDATPTGLTDLSEEVVEKLTGIISSYDLLKLVEGHRFVMKNQGTKSQKKSLSL